MTPAQLWQIRWYVSLWIIAGLASTGCGRKPAEVVKGKTDSGISVNTSSSGPLLIKTSAAEFRMFPTGYLKADLIRDGANLSLDDAQGESDNTADTLFSDGKQIRDFILDLEHAKVSASSGRLGRHGTRIELTGHSHSLPEIEKTEFVEIYDSFPTLALVSISYKNIGGSEIALDRVSTQEHVLDASLSNPKVPPYAMWSFHGSSEAWGKDDVTPVCPSQSDAGRNA